MMTPPIDGPRPSTPAAITAPRAYTPAVGKEGFPPPALNPEHTEIALKHLISNLDYDVYKEMEEDDSFPSFTRNFIRYYEAVAAQ